MPYYFDNATLLGYSLDKSYSSENNDIILNQTKNISLEGILDYRSINKDAAGVKEYFNDIENIVDLSSGDVQDITINGYFLGSGRIKNVSFDKENPILFGKYKYDIEIIDQSDLSRLSNDYYGTFLSGVSEKILDLNENFDFNYGNGKYSYNHNLDIKLARSNEAEDLLTKTKALASGILSDSINLGFIQGYSGLYNTLKNKRHIVSERYDLIENSFSFSKSIEIDTSYSGDYSVQLKHVLSNDGLGKTSVQENGIITFITENLSTGQKNSIYNQELINSFSRCSTIFNNSALKYNFGTSYASLNSKPQSLTRKNNIFDNVIEYTASYVNDITYFGNYFLNYEINEKKDSVGEIETSENGEIIIIGTSGQITFPNQIIEQRKSSYPIVKNYTIGYSLLNTGINYDNIFKYSITSTNNTSYRPNDLITFLSVSSESNLPTPIITEFLFPEKIFKIKANSNKLGEFSTKIRAIIPGPQISTPDLLLSQLVWTASTNSYITKALYSYDSDGNVNCEINQML